MSYQHKDLAAGRWDQLSFVEQMANVGSELERAINWHKKQNAAHYQKAFDRMLELIDLTLSGSKSFARLKELARLREAIVDYFAGPNSFQFTDGALRSYFLHFVYAARKHR